MHTDLMAHQMEQGYSLVRKATIAFYALLGAGCLWCTAVLVRETKQ